MFTLSSVTLSFAFLGLVRPTSFISPLDEACISSTNRLPPPARLCSPPASPLFLLPRRNAVAFLSCLAPVLCFALALPVAFAFALLAAFALALCLFFPCFNPLDVGSTVFAQHLGEFGLLHASLQSVRSEQIRRILDALVPLGSTVRSIDSVRCFGRIATTE